MPAVNIFWSRSHSFLLRILSFLFLPSWYRRLDISDPRHCFLHMRFALLAILSVTFCLLLSTLVILNLTLAYHYFVWCHNVASAGAFLLLVLLIRFFPIRSTASATTFALLISWAIVIIFLYRITVGFWWHGGITAPSTVWFAAFFIIITSALLTPTQTRWFLLVFFADVLVIFLIINVLCLGHLDQRQLPTILDEVSGFIIFCTLLFLTAVCPWTTESRLLTSEVRALREREATMKTETIAVLMHETRNPLHQAICSLDSLAYDFHVPQDRLEAVTATLRQARLF